MSQELKAILSRIEERLTALDMSAHAAEQSAGKPDFIRNLRRAISSGSRKGMSTDTLFALAPVLGVSPEWLLTGRSCPPGGLGDFAVSDTLKSVGRNSDPSVGPGGAITLDMDVLAWAFAALDGFDDAEARVLARAVLRAARMLKIHEGGGRDTDSTRRKLIETAIRLFRP